MLVFHSYSLLYSIFNLFNRFVLIVFGRNSLLYSIFNLSYGYIWYFIITILVFSLINGKIIINRYNNVENYNLIVKFLNRLISNASFSNKNKHSIMDSTNHSSTETITNSGAFMLDQCLAGQTQILELLQEMMKSILSKQ